MLTILENRDEREAERLLSAVTKKLLPDPGIHDGEALPPEFATLRDRLLGEIYTELQLDPADQSPQAQTKLFQFLSKEMNRSLTPERREAAQARLEARGWLPRSTYHVQFGDFFREPETRGVSRVQVEEAIHSPSHVKHFVPGMFLRGPHDTLSIYTKVYAPSDPMHHYTLLVIAQPIGDTQYVAAAWRAYHEEVSIAATIEPVEALRAFVEVYGIPFRVGTSAPTKFVLYENFHSAPDRGMTFDTDLQSFYGTRFFRRSDSGVIEIALAYIIDLPRYLTDLRKHRVLHV